MNAPFKQTDRLGRLTTELGENALVLLRFEGSDYLNGMFEFRVDALSTREDIDFDALIGTHATVEVEAHDVMRPFDGIVTSAQYAGVGENGHIYALTLRPWLWLAGKRRNFRIFHRKTVDQILKELLSDYGVFSNPHLEFRLGTQYEELEYTVQHGISDLEFARRQMEKHGISFHFRHAKGSHTLVLTDDELAHEVIGEIPFKRYDGHHQYEYEHFWDWKPERNFTTGGIRQVDYNFKHPTQSMETWQASDAQYAFGHVESYDYPGDYLSEGPGKIVTRMRQRQERGADRRNRAVGDCVSLASGQRVKLGGDKVPGHGETYLCLSATHRFVSEAYGSGGHESDGYSYTGSYVLMPDTAPMVPPKQTPLSRVYGPQTAMVVGEGEIDCDEYGRILVQFHWDLDKAYSMRCRVSQNWSGNGWGGMVIPRIGMEVVVEFLEGDPDKPLVTGCVYNGRNSTPYPLPEHKTRSTFKTDTHQGSGFNELRFEDKKDEEEVFLHAQRDRNSKIENNQSERVNANKVESIGHSKAVEIGNNFYEIVDGDMELRVGPANTGTYTPSGADKQTQGISSVPALLGTPGQARKGTGDLKISVEKTKTQVIGKDHFETVEGDKESHIRENHTVKVRKKIRIEAGDELLLICGKSRIKLTENGTIEVNGQKIMQLGDQIVTVQSDTIKLN